MINSTQNYEKAQKTAKIEQLDSSKTTTFDARTEIHEARRMLTGNGRMLIISESKGGSCRSLTEFHECERKDGGEGKGHWTRKTFRRP